MELSLFYFADDATAHGGHGYDLLLDGARFADDAGLRAIWTPERHFHNFGGLYPNPSVTGAAVAAITRRVGVRAGSVVLPLHDPIRVAEEWSMVDNISNGRVAVAFASGWHANDFALHPTPATAYGKRKDLLVDHVDTVRRLWRGEAVTRSDGSGETVAVRIMPRPIQPELPFWITTSGNPETFRLAGHLGGNLLTHLLGQNVETLRQKIDVYRAARRERHSGPGHVTLMLHTHLGKSDAVVREEIREPFSRYLASSIDLLVRSGPTTKDIELEPAEAKVLVDRAFDRYSRDSGLFGCVDTAGQILTRLAAAGVDEVACLTDFGVPRTAVLRSLNYLADLARADDELSR